MREKHRARKNIPHADFQTKQRKNTSKEWNYLQFQENSQKKFQHFAVPFGSHPMSGGANINLKRAADFLKILMVLPIPKTIVLPIVLLMFSTSVFADNPPDDEVTGCSIDQKSLVDIKALVGQRFVVDTAGTNLNHSVCISKITENIAKTIEIFPHSESYIGRVLHNEKLKIVCTTSKKIKASNSDSTQAYFQTSGKIFFAPIVEGGESAMVTINHEFMHADTFFRHAKNPCYRKNPFNALAPIHPYSLKNIQKYHKAFDLGDARIAEFGILRAGKRFSKKTLSTQRLTENENKLLERYTAAAADFFFDKNIGNSLIGIALMPSEYQMLVDKGYLDKGLKAGDTCFYPSGVRGKIVFIGLENNQFVLKLRPLDVASKLIALPDRAKIYTKYKDPDIKIAEREAHTFQYLSEEAIKTFYPEAYELRKIYISQCVSVEDLESVGQFTTCKI